MIPLYIQHEIIIDHLHKHAIEVSVQEITDEAWQKNWSMHIVPLSSKSYYMVSDSGECYAFVDTSDYPSGWLAPGEQGPKNEDQVWYNDHGVTSLADMDNLGGYPTHYGSVGSCESDGGSDNNSWMD